MEGKIIFHKREKKEFGLIAISKNYLDEIDHISDTCDMSRQDVADMLINFALRYTIIDEGEES